MLFNEREEKALYEGLQFAWATYKMLERVIPTEILNLIERFEKEHPEWFYIEE